MILAKKNRLRYVIDNAAHSVCTGIPQDDDSYVARQDNASDREDKRTLFIEAILDFEITPPIDSGDFYVLK